MIEQKWIRFEPRCTKRNLAAGLVGAAIVYFMLELLLPPVIRLMGSLWGTFTANVIVMLFIVAIWPAVLKGTERQEEHR